MKNYLHLIFFHLVVHCQCEQICLAVKQDYSQQYDTEIVQDETLGCSHIYSERAPSFDCIKEARSQCMLCDDGYETSLIINIIIII